MAALLQGSGRQRLVFVITPREQPVRHATARFGKTSPCPRPRRTTLHRVIRNGAIPQTTVSLLQLRAGQILGSTYYTEAERVALEMVKAVLSPNPSGERVPDELYAKASAHYDDNAFWTLIMAIAHIGFFTPAALVA